MNKTDLINAVAEQADLTKKEAGSAVDAVFESIQNSLAKGEKVQLIGFGNFEVRERAARKGRNPQSGEEIELNQDGKSFYTGFNQLYRLNTYC